MHVFLFFFDFITNIVRDCGIPSPVRDALVAFNHTTVDAIATFHCAVGYIPTTSNNPMIICGLNGEWRGETLQCSEFL